MRATSLEASANRIASFCESLRVGSTQSIFPTSGSVVRSAGTGEGEDRPKSTLMKMDCSDSDIFSSFSIVNFILLEGSATRELINRQRSLTSYT